MFIGIFNGSPEATLYHDKEGSIININPRFTELFGYALEEVKGRNIDSGIVHPSGKLEEGEKLTKKSLKGYLNFETIRKKKDGMEMVTGLKKLCWKFAINIRFRETFFPG
ncbi:MAG: PAS domain S-box protein [Atribacterota bacterium]|nr:PAS domain S-box protein [Atribacterota bacterium]